MKNKGKILAIDFGEKTVGLAVSDENRLMVFGRGVIRDFRSLAGLFERIGRFCAKENIVGVVMGLPYGKDGEETLQTARIRAIGQKLEQYLKEITVDFEDESFSSFEADEYLSRIGAVKGRERKQMEDETAAVIILKRYLDSEA